VMKMYITLVAPEDGVLKQLKPEGSIIEAGDLLASLTLDHPERVQKAELFTGTFPSMQVTIPAAESGVYKNNQVNLTLKECHRKLLNLLQGYAVSQAGIRTVVENLMNCLRAPILPLEQFREALSSITSRIPASLVQSLHSILDGYAENVQHHRFSWESPEEFPVIELQNAIDTTMNSLATEEEKNKLINSLSGAGVLSLLQLYKTGNHGYAVHVLSGLWEEFLSVESHFCTDASGDSEKTAPEFVIKALRKVRKSRSMQRCEPRGGHSHCVLHSLFMCSSSVTRMIWRELLAWPALTISWPSATNWWFCCWISFKSSCLPCCMSSFPSCASWLD
jgi:acetyl-CoA carboxylase/biotin carboxylase 1